MTDTDEGVVKRYRPDITSDRASTAAVMLPHERGNWIKYDDHAAIVEKLRAELGRVERENATLRVAFQVADDQSEHCQSLVEGLEKERDALVGELRWCLRNCEAQCASDAAEWAERQVRIDGLLARGGGGT